MALALAPLVVVWWLKTQSEPRPFWVHYYDPEAIYFFEGLDLVRLRAPESFDRPGAQVQLLSAVIALARSSTALDFDAFRKSAYAVSLALLVGGVVLLFRTTLAGLPARAALVGAWIYFACPQSLEYLAVWSPEALYLPVGALALALLCRAEVEEIRAGSLFAAGLGVGTLCALKLTFLPWAVGLAVASFAIGGTGLLKRSARALIASSGVVLAFVAWTAHMFPHLPDLVAWTWRLVSRGGEYGSGTLGVPTLAGGWANVSALLLAAKGWYLVLAGLLGFVAIRLSREARRKNLQTGTIWLAVFAATSLFIGLAFAVRQPVPRYYLATGLLAILFIRIGYRRARHSRLDGLAGAALLAFVTLLMIKQAVLDIRTHRSRIASESALRVELETAVAEGESARGEQPVIWGFRAPIPALALHVMARSEEDHAEVFRAYPGEGFVDWQGNLRLPPGARYWGWLVLQRNEAPDAELVCDRAGEVGRFHLFRWEGCGPNLPSLPPASRRGQRVDPG